jgi:hypothetical protein
VNPVVVRAAAAFLTNRHGRSGTAILIVLALIALFAIPAGIVLVVGYGLAAVVSDPASSPYPVAACLPASVQAAASDGTGTLNATQQARAREVIQVGQSRQIPTRGVVVALAVGLQESRLRNLASERVPASLSYAYDAIAPGDRDSVGVFQQRGKGWGDLAGRMTPTVSAARFYAALVKVKGWEKLPVTVAAQRVQVSATPTAYAPWETLARALAGQAGMVDDCITGPLTECPPTGWPVEVGMTPAGLAVQRCAHQQFPGLLSIGGNYPAPSDSDHSNGRAVDLMVPAWDTPSGQQYGWVVANWMRAHSATLHIRYVIFSRHIWNTERNDEGWRAYTRYGGHGDPSEDHLNHVHVSVKEEGGQ